MNDTLIDQGLNLMIYGMGTVFVFLTILVFATSLMSKLVNKFAPADSELEAAAAAATNINPSATDGQPRPQILAAIKQAISQHRNS